MNQQTRYNKAYVIVAAIAMVVLGFFGYQWYQKYYFKNLLQQEFDSQYQRWGRGWNGNTFLNKKVNGYLFF